MKRLKRALHYVNKQIDSLKDRRTRIRHRIANKRNRNGEAAMRDRVVAEIKACNGVGFYNLQWRSYGAWNLKTHGSDCSGWVSHLAAVANVDLKALCGTPYPDTSLLAEHLPKGKGKWFTLYLLTGNGGAEDHVIADIINKHGRSIFTECGGRDNPYSRGGPAIFYPSSSRLSEFHQVRHLPGC